MDCKNLKSSLGAFAVVIGIGLSYEKVVSYFYGEENLVDVSRSHEVFLEDVSSKFIGFFTESSADFIKIFTNEEVDKKVDVICKNIASSWGDMSEELSDKLFSVLRSSLDDDDRQAFVEATTEEEVNKRVEAILNKVAAKLENIDKFNLAEDGSVLKIALATESVSSSDHVVEVTGEVEVTQEEV